MAAALGIACFINVLPNDFCNDGHVIVRENAKVNESGQWLTIWSTDYWSEAVQDNPNRDLLYRPVAVMSYRLVRIAFGVRAWPHHLVNLLLYGVLCALVARVCLAMGGTRRAALIASAFFAVLPIHTEVVNNVVGRADLLAAVGMLLAILLHERSMTAVSRAHAVGWRTLAAVTAFAAMGSKESAVGLVAVVPLFDALWHRRANGVNAARKAWLCGRTVWRLSYLIAPALVYLLLRYFALGGALHQRPSITKAINVLVDAPAWQHALGVVQLWGMYWAKMFWPKVLCVNYSVNAIRLATDMGDLHFMIGGAVALVLLAASVITWRRGVPQIALLTLALMLTYAPTSNALVLMQVFFAERIWFIASIWAAMLVGFACARYKRDVMLTSILVVVLTGMSLRCWVRNNEWRNDGTLYAAAYRDLPDAVGVTYLYGQWLALHGQYEAGVNLLSQTVETDLGFTDAHRALGAAHLGAGQTALAVRHLQIADYQVPNHPATVAALARAGKALAGRDAALQRLRQDAEDNPADVQVELALIRRLREVGFTEEALARFSRREGQFAGSADWQVEYAATLLFGGRRDEAIRRYDLGLEIEPEHAQRLVELAMLLLERRGEGDLDHAWTLAERAARLAPNAPSVLVCRAELLAARGDVAGAIVAYGRAIRALPPGSAQRRMFEQRARALGWRPQP